MPITAFRDDRRVAALEAIRHYTARFNRMPTAAGWAAAGMTPSEKTIRRLFGSFRAAFDAAESDAPARLWL